MLFSLLTCRGLSSRSENFGRPFMHITTASYVRNSDSVTTEVCGDSKLKLTSVSVHDHHPLARRKEFLEVAVHVLKLNRVFAALRRSAVRFRSMLSKMRDRKSVV